MNEQLDTVLRLARQAGFKFHSGFLNGETRSLPLCLSELECFYSLAIEDNGKKNGGAKRHWCELNSPNDGYGAAVEQCCEWSDGTLWVGNGEYASQVNFCPVCGHKAKTAIGSLK